jgi:hypothetical protein
MPRLFLLPSGKGKRVFLWGLAFFAVAQLALWTWLECSRPEVHDPLYTLRLESLRARLAESPGAPLVLLLGSSRTKYGVWPAAMNLRPSASGQTPVVYNFGLNGMGSIRALMYFRRLLADGIRPAWVLVETWPPQWPEEGYFAESRLVLGEDELHWGDMPTVSRYFSNNREVLHRGLRKCLLPLQAYRSRLLEATAPEMLPRKQIEDMTKQRSDWVPQDNTGWFALTWGPTTPEEIQEALKRGREQMGPLLNPLQIDPSCDAAFRALLGECRTRGIKTAVFLLPEHSGARAQYSPQARALVRSYLASLRHDFDAPILDTRDWLPDSNFTDFCHIWHHAAGPFSERFGRDALQPLLDGKPLDGDSLVRDIAP